jgi:hypothetical protein
MTERPTTVVGEMNLEQWINGKVSIEIGELDETSP